jgi:DNA-binding response OmpR family regulator
MRVMMLEARTGFRTSWIAALQSSGFDLDLFPLLAEGEEALLQFSYEMLLINREMPDGDGVDWLRSRRRAGLSTPLVVMTPPHDLENRIRALDAGADDAVTDSLDSRELIARLRALLRRQPFLRPQIIETGNLQLDLAARQISVAGVAVPIPRRELGILEKLMTSFNRTVTRNSLETSIYGAAGDVCANSIEVRMSRLRRLLARNGADVEIETLRGLGYRLQLRSAARPAKRTQKLQQG